MFFSPQNVSFTSKVALSKKFLMFLVTNNEAEWKSLIMGLREAVEVSAVMIQVFIDS